jgi:hypothetical protein
MSSNPSPSKSPDAAAPASGPSPLLGTAIIVAVPIAFFALMFGLRAMGAS